MPGLEFVESRPLGGAWLLDGLWHRLGIDTLLRRLAAGTRRDPVVERVLFALVANRALAPSSKLAATSLGRPRRAPARPGRQVSDDACYRAMDWLIAVEDRLARGVFDAVAHLLNLEVDLIFFDTTSTYFETEDADEPVWRDEHGRVLDTGQPSTDGGDGSGDGRVSRRRARAAGGVPQPRQVQGLPRRPPAGRGRDGRDPRRDPGAGVVLAGQHQRLAADPPGEGRAAGLDPGEGHLGRRPRVHLRGRTAATSPPAADGYILGEKLRSGSAEATAALARQGRYQEVSREPAGQGSQGQRARAVRGLPQPRRRRPRRRRPRQPGRPARSDDRRLGPAVPTKRAELRGVISTKPGLNRFLRITPCGLLRLDAAKITADAKLDGKYLLRTSDPHLSTEDIALGYKQLLEVERGWRDMKQVLDLRPVYHRLEDRIRAHVLLCWLALLLARIVETRASTPDTGHDLAPRPRPSCSACTSARSPARPGCSARPPHPAPRPAGCTPPSTSPLPPRILDLDTEHAATPLTRHNTPA